MFSLQDFQHPQILFIVGDPKELDDSFDQPFYNHMLNNLNYSIILHDNNDSYQYEGYDAIVISQTILETGTVDSLTNASIPILSMVAGTYDEFKLGTGSGVIATGDSLYILNNNSYITQGLTNQSDWQVYNSSGQISFLKGYAAIDPEVKTVSLAQRSKVIGNERALVILDKGKKDWNLTLAPELRAFWGAPQGNVLNQDGWDRWEKTLKWTLYDDVPGNATIQVDINDLDNRKVSNARVNLPDAQDSLQMWSQNTTSDGFTIFTNIPYGYYNITVEYKDSINDSVTFLEIAGVQTYETEAYFAISIQVAEYIDDTPPLVTNILFDNDTKSFLADILDESALTTIYLNLTAINTTDLSVTLPPKNYTMVKQTGDTYYNDTALLPLNNTDVEIFYNIIATDIASNSRVTTIQSFILGDPNPPIIHEYNVTDYENGTVQFYANISDDEGFVQDPVILKINDSFEDMHLNDSGYWVYRTEVYYNVTLNYTIYSAEDNVGNKVSSTDFELITPTDSQVPNIWGVTDSFSSHENGYVEISGYVYDWNEYQSGVNVTDVKIILSINDGANLRYNMLAIGEITYYFEYTFDYNDTVSYWITASDLAGNIHSGIQHGPFIIGDNAIPQIIFGAKEFGNGTVEFNAIIVDWPLNETKSVLYFTQDVDGTWFNVSMTNLTKTFYVVQVHNFDYNQRDVWFYVTANDSAGNKYEPASDQYLKIILSDMIPPAVLFSIENSTIHDGEITISAYANDPYGSSVYVNNTFYVNITTEESSIETIMEYFEFYRYTYTESFKYEQQLTITVWTHDSAGNLGLLNRTITITDHAPPIITNLYIYDDQQGSIFLSAEIYDGAFGSGLPEDNSSIIVEYSFKTLVIDTMQWNGSGNFYEYSITGFEPGDVIVYQINATDIAGNTYSTSLARYIIIDNTPPVISSWGYSQDLVDNYLTELKFWINASDPFGNIMRVNISILDLNTSEWIIMNENMHYIENNYSFSTQIICNHIFQYIIHVGDGKNSIAVSEMDQRTLDFQPPEILDFKVTFNQSETYTGLAHFWIEVNDSFEDDLVVKLSVLDETSETWLLDDIPINKTHRSLNETIIFYDEVNITYHHNFSYFFEVTDLGVIKGYYNIGTYTKNQIVQMLDVWAPVIHDTGVVKADNETLIIWALISDWGSNVSKAQVEYQFLSEEGIGLGAEAKTQEILMQDNGTHYTTNLVFSTSGTLKWIIKVFDHENNFCIYSSPKDYLYISPQPRVSPQELDLLLILTVSAITVIVASIVLVIGRSYQKRIRAQKREQKEIVDKCTDIFSLRAIICRNQFGLAFYTENFVEKDQDEDMIAGLTSTMSSMVSEIAQREIKSGEFDALEREGFSILSYHWESFTISVVSDEKLSSFMKTKIRELANQIESHFTKEELEDPLIYELKDKTERLVYEILPLGLLQALTIDFTLLEQKKKHFKKNEQKWFDYVEEIPSFIDGQQIFYAMTFISSLTVQGISLVNAFHFLDRCYNLGVIRNLSEPEREFFVSDGSSSAT